MAAPDLNSLRYLEHGGSIFLSWLQPRPDYWTLKIDQGGLTYGPQLIPLNSIVGVSLRSRSLAMGTPARQLLDIVLGGGALLVVAFLDTRYFHSKLFSLLMASTEWTAEWSFWLKLVVIGFAIYLVISLRIVYAVAVAIVLDLVLTMPGNRYWDGLPESTFGKYHEWSRDLVAFIGSSPALILLAVALLYADLALDRKRWSLLGFRSWLRDPYWPRILVDTSTADLAIETAAGRTVWIKLPLRPWREGINHAIFGARIVSMIRDRINVREASAAAVIDLRKHQIYSTDSSLVHLKQEAQGGKGTGDLYTLLKTDAIERSRLVNTPPDLVLREITLLLHELERLPGRDATGYFLLLRDVEQFTLGLRAGMRVSNSETIWRGEVKRAKRAAEELSRDQISYGVLSHQIDGRLEPIDFGERFRFLASWVLVQANKPASDDKSREA